MRGRATNPNSPAKMLNLGQTPKHNLVEKVKVEQKLYPEGFASSIVLDVLSVLSALSFGYLYRQYVSDAVGFWTLFFPVGALCILSVLESMLVKNFWRRMLVVVLESFALAAFFLDKPLNIILISFGLSVFFLGWGEISSRGELQNTLEIKFISVAKPHISKIVTAAVFAAILFYIPTLKKDSTFISRPTFDSIYSWISSISGRMYPEINLESTMGDLARGVVTYQIAENASFRLLPPAIQNQMIDQASKEFIANAGRSMKINVSANDSVRTLVYAYLADLFGRWQKNFGTTFFVGWVIVIFLLVRSFGFLFTWIVAVLGFFIYHALLALNFIQISGETRVHEVATFG